MIRKEIDAQHFRTRARERELARGFDEAFDITHAYSRAPLSFWFAEPKIHAKDRFGFQQELLVIYSPFAKPDARILTAIEKVNAIPDFKHRLEKFVVLVLHDGNSNEMREFFGGHAEHIIVPIRNSELLNPSRGSVFLRCKIAEIVGSVDLFGKSSPVSSDRYFFGRDELVQHLVNRTISQRENTGLFGLRKTGKTSVLFAIQRRVADDPVIAEYVDCQNPGIHGARWWQLLESLAGRCAESLKSLKRRKARVKTGYEVSTGRGPVFCRH